MFWSLFIPLGCAASVDRCRGIRSQPKSICTAATAALVLQLAAIYFFSALLKTHPVWRSEFTALYHALASGHFTNSFGLALCDYPALLKLLTFATIVLELCGPIVLLCPWKDWRVRAGVVLSFCLLHAGIAATMKLGLFPAICIVYWLAMMPGEFWETALMRRVTGRFWQNHPEAAATPSTPRLTLGGISLVLTLLAYVLLLNATRLHNSVYAHLPLGPLRTLGDAAQLNQFWCMFSPQPPYFRGWFDMRGTLADGRQINLLDPSLPPQAEPPKNISNLTPSLPWRKCLMNLMERDCPTHRRAVGEYLMRRWNAAHGPDEQLVAAAIVHATRMLPGADRSGAPLAEVQELWRWDAAKHAISP